MESKQPIKDEFGTIIMDDEDAGIEQLKRRVNILELLVREANSQVETLYKLISEGKHRGI